MAPRALSAVALAVLFAAGSAQAAGERGDLFGRGYVSKAVLKDGEPHAVFDGTKIKVDFDHGTDHDAISWQADCNYFGAEVEITEERLLIGEGVQTTVGCLKRQHRRDRWMKRFFGSNPTWRIPRDDRLKLTAGERVIKLTSPPPDR